MAKHLLPCLTLGLLAACSDGTPPPSRSGEVERIDLLDAFGVAVVDAVGVTVAPDTGEVYVLDAGFGLFVAEPDGSFRPFAEAAELYSVSPQSPFTDVAALGQGRFALTAVNDGFLYDSATGSIRQHFCYVPGFFIGQPPPIIQLTNSVAWDPTRRRILVQPVTMDSRTFARQASEVGTFPITGGQGNDWHPIHDTSFLSGAIAVDGTGDLWLAEGADLYRYDLDGDILEWEQSLGRFGITNITGMSFTQDRLLVIDASTQTLVWIPLIMLEG